MTNEDLRAENAQLRSALTKCVASLDQLLPHLGKVPADVGLLNEALLAARPALLDAPRCQCCGYLVTQSEHRGCLRSASLPPEVNAIFETCDGGAIGTTSAKVKRVEWQDDGSIMVVIDHWPQPAASVGPVAYLFADEVGRTKIVLGKETAELWCPPGETITPLYAHPPATPDVQGMVEALENARRAMYAVQKQEPRLKAVARRVLSVEIERIDATLSAHNKSPI